MINKTFAKVEYCGYWITETLRRINTSHEDVLQHRWVISFVDSFGVEVSFGEAHDLDGARRKVDTHLSRKQ